MAARASQEIEGSAAEVATPTYEVGALAEVWFDELPAAATSSSSAASAATASGGSKLAKPAPKAPIASLGRFYITTAINYANGPPHMGHAYEAVIADVIARYHRAYGREVYFLTGADEHGQKIADTAKGLDLQPIELCDRHVAHFQQLDKTLHADYDGYVRTTSDAHKKLARQLWAKCEKAGGVYLGKYCGWYNVREETFVTETDAQANDYKDPVSGKDLKKMEEDSYFFKLSAYQQKLIEHIKANPEFVMPEARRNEVLERLAVPLQDLSVSRTTFDWGIACPGDVPGHVMYVWFDALSNYLSGIGYDADAPNPSKSSPLAKFWPANIHLIGKDIIWFHCVIWPAILMCAGCALPKTVLAHGFVHGGDGRKMSKSLGNVVDPYEVLTRFPVDSFRFFLVRDAPFGGDVTFSETALALRHNSELADTFGNLVHRSLALALKYCGGKVPDVAAAPNVVDVGALKTSTEAAIAAHQLDVAAGYAIGVLNNTNKYLTDTEPWHMKADDPQRLVVVRTTLEAIYVASLYLQPYLIDGANAVFKKLNTPPRPLHSLEDGLCHLTPGTATSAGDILYQKAETKEAIEQQMREAEEKKKKETERNRKDAAKAASGGGAQSDFSKVDLRVGKIVEVKPHPDSENLYVEKIDLGESSGPRTVVSGLAKFIPLEQMKGRRVVCVTNLKGRAIVGVDSQAMVLCGKGEGAMELVEPPEGVPPGERVLCEGHDAPPEAQLNPKKKIWEKEVQPKLNVSDACVARFGELPFTTSGGVCTVQTLKGCDIG